MADVIIDGRVRVAFVPTIANNAAPTTSELNAGTLLQTNLIPAGVEGFENSTATVDNTSLASTFDTTLPGRQSLSGTQLTFKRQTVTGTDAVWTLMTTPNTDGYIVFRDGVDQSAAWTTGDKVEVYPVRTAVHTTLGRGESNALLRYRVPVMVTAQPSLKAVVA